MNIAKTISLILFTFLLQHNNAFGQCASCYTDIEVKEKCKDKATTLTANTNGDRVSWSTDGGDSETILKKEGFTTTVKPEVKTRYLATTTHMLENLIVNGSFDSSVVTFNTDYVPGNSGSFRNGEYALTTNPNDYLPAFLPKEDHTGNGGYLLLVDGNDEEDNSVVWSDSVEVVEGEDYFFSLVAANIHENFLGSGDKSSYNHPDIAIYINGELMKNQELPDDTSWTKLSFIWNASSTGKVEISIEDLDKGIKENDFVLDDLIFQQMYYSQAFIDVEPCYSGEVFSPDGDGAYDTYFIEKTGTAKIYDANGNLIKSLSVPAHWNGANEEGKQSPTGYYVIIINDSIVRHVTLVR